MPDFLPMLSYEVSLASKTVVRISRATAAVELDPEPDAIEGAATTLGTKRPNSKARHEAINETDIVCT